MDVRLRSYDDADLSVCRDLWRELTQRHRDIYDDQTIGGRDPGIEFDAFLARKPTRVWVAEDTGKVVGLCGLLVADGEAEIDPMVVRSDLRSRGIGGRMIGHAIAEARQLGARSLSVRPVARNVEAIKLYHQAGFRILGHLDMFMDLVGERQWKPGIELHGQKFRY